MGTLLSTETHLWGPKNLRPEIHSRQNFPWCRSTKFSKLNDVQTTHHRLVMQQQKPQQKTPATPLITPGEVVIRQPQPATARTFLINFHSITFQSWLVSIKNACPPIQPQSCRSEMKSGTTPRHHPVVPREHLQHGATALNESLEKRQEFHHHKITDTEMVL